MNDDRTEPPSIRRTTLDPSEHYVDLNCWTTPIKCDGCGERVDTFMRYNAPTEAMCSGCGSEWTFAPNPEEVAE